MISKTKDGGSEVMNIKDLSGRRFGRLVAVKIANKSSNGNIWNCICDCGSETRVLSTNLIRNHTKSCGCLRTEKVTDMNRTHGMRHERLYSIWTDMKTRCNNPKKDMYYAYGGKGIRVCDEWEKDFLCFHKWAMENGYGINLTIERKDNSEGYGPLNCKWATTLEQSRNRSVSLTLTDGKGCCSLKELSNKHKINYHTLYSKLKRNGMLNINGVAYYILQK
jgi:hypothetical protein